MTQFDSGRPDMVKLIGITGGTGAGKSSTCTRLVDSYPSRIGLVQLDDYFKPESEVPELDSIKNWDHPDALYLDTFADDLRKLKAGETVMIKTKNLRLNPDYARTGERIAVRFDPKPVMLVEGFLTLWHPGVRTLLDDSVYLDIPHDTRYVRRVHFKNSEYETKVLLPMQEQFVEPTKKFAHRVLDVSMMDADGVYEAVERIVKPHFV